VVYVMALSWTKGWFVNYDLEMCGRKRSWLMYTFRTVPRLCANCVVMLKVQIVIPIWITQWGHIWFSHTGLFLPCFNHVIVDFLESDFWRPQHNTFGTQFCMCKLKYSILSGVCRWPVGHPSFSPLFWLLLATTWTFMKVVSRMLIVQK
jgi:hypothetical protein